MLVEVLTGVLTGVFVALVAFVLAQVAFSYREYRVGASRELRVLRAVREEVRSNLALLSGNWHAVKREMEGLEDQRHSRI